MRPCVRHVHAQLVVDFPTQKKNEYYILVSTKKENILRKENLLHHPNKGMINPSK
jgi:hypothetical protein